MEMGKAGAQSNQGTYVLVTMERLASSSHLARSLILLSFLVTERRPFFHRSPRVALMRHSLSAETNRTIPDRDVVTPEELAIEFFNPV